MIGVEGPDLAAAAAASDGRFSGLCRGLRMTGLARPMSFATLLEKSRRR